MNILFTDGNEDHDVPFNLASAVESTGKFIFDPLTEHFDWVCGLRFPD